MRQAGNMSKADKKVTPRPKAKPFRSAKYLKHIRSLPCCNCGYPVSEAHHVETGGMGTKCGDDLTVPLCGPSGRGCHQKADKSKTSVKRYKPLARKLFREWGAKQQVTPQNDPAKIMVNCLLPGADEVAAGKAVEEVFEKALSPQHDRFCREFIIDENAVRAYQRAYKESLATYESAAASATRLLKDVKIQARIEMLRAERNKRLEISADRVLTELAKLAFYDPRNLFDDDGRLKPISDLDPDHAAVIAGIETVHKIVGDDKDGLSVLTKIKLPDKKGALELIGRNMAMWKDVGSKENPAEMVHRVERVIVSPKIAHTED